MAVSNSTIVKPAGDAVPPTLPEASLSGAHERTGKADDWRRTVPFIAGMGPRRVFSQTRNRRFGGFWQAALLCAAMLSIGGPAAAAQAQITPREWQAVAHALGVPGEIRGEAFRVDFAPVVSQIVVRGARLGPASFGSCWATFLRQGDLGVMIGRLLLPAAKAPGIAGRLAGAGIDLSAEVAPYPGSSPAVVAVYFRATGEPARMAATLHKALGAMLRAPERLTRAEAGALDVNAINGVMGRSGQAESGALVFRLARPETLKCCGLPNDPLLVFSGIALGPETGFQSRIAFQGDRVRATVSGHLLLRREEIGPVERALAVFGIEMTSLAETFPDEEPRMLFLHFFGIGKPLDLAQGLRAAIERTRQTPVSPVPAGMQP